MISSLCRSVSHCCHPHSETMTVCMQVTEAMEMAERLAASLDRNINAAEDVTSQVRHTSKVQAYSAMLLVGTWVSSSTTNTAAGHSTGCRLSPCTHSPPGFAPPVQPWTQPLCAAIAVCLTYSLICSSVSTLACPASAQVMLMAQHLTAC